MSTCWRTSFLGLLLASFVCAAHQEETFLRANQLYDQKEYDKALQEYQALTDKGSTVWYNMGNCAFQVGHYMQALAYYKCAQKDAIGLLRADVLHNIDVVENKLGHTHIQTRTQRWLQYIQAWVMVVPWLLLQLLVLSILLVVFLVLKNWRVRKRYGVLTVFLVLSIVFTSVLLLKYNHDVSRVGIVVHPQVIVRAGPDKNYPAVSTMNEATEVTVEEMRVLWYKVTYNTNVGWVSSDDIVVV